MSVITPRRRQVISLLSTIGEASPENRLLLASTPALVGPMLRLLAEETSGDHLVVVHTWHATCSFRRSSTDRRASSRWHSHNYLVAADTTRHDVAQFFFDLGVYSDVRKKLLEQGMLPAVLHLAKGSAILQRSLARILDRFSEDDDCKAPR